MDLQAIAQPDTNFGSPIKIFKQVLEHEIFVTTRIHLLYGIAVAEKDYATQVFLQWFINEQVEEEKHAGEILETLKLGGDTGSALIMMDKSLGARKIKKEVSFRNLFFFNYQPLKNGSQSSYKVK